MMRLLVSVRDPQEALLAAAGGAGFIDAKDPGRGALGGLPVGTIAAIVAALRAAGHRHEVSATIGDLRMHERARIERQVRAVGATGVDIVKVGILREPGAAEVLARLATLPWAIVPVFIADDGLDEALVARACALGFPGVMADTQDKRVGSLFDVADEPALRRFVERVQAAGKLAGLAGALRVADLPRVARLAPDFAGFRSAVCAGDRAAALDPQRLQRLVEAAAAACGQPTAALG